MALNMFVSLPSTADERDKSSNLRFHPSTHHYGAASACSSILYNQGSVTKKKVWSRNKTQIVQDSSTMDRRRQGDKSSRCMWHTRLWKPLQYFNTMSKKASCDSSIAKNQCSWWCSAFTYLLSTLLQISPQNSQRGQKQNAFFLKNQKQNVFPLNCFVLVTTRARQTTISIQRTR
jgi:hypothetical protein